MSGVIIFRPSFSGGPGKTALFYSFAAAVGSKKGAVLTIPAQKTLFSNSCEDIGIFPGEDRTGKDPGTSLEFLTVIKNIQTQSQKTILCWEPPLPSVFQLSDLSKFPGPVLLESTDLLLPESSYVFCFTPTLEDVHHAAVHMKWLVVRGVSDAHIHPVLWDNGVAADVSHSLIEEELKRKIIRWKGEGSFLVAAENAGKVVQKLNSRHRLTRAMEETVARVFSAPLNAPTAEKGACSGMDGKDRERKIVSAVWRRIQEARGSENSSETWLMAQIETEIASVINEGNSLLSDTEVFHSLRQRIKDHVTGYGPIEGLMKDGAVSDIMINGSDIYVEHDGRMAKTPEKFENEKQLRIVIDRMVGRVGRRVDMAAPLCDVRLEDGSRVNVVLPPLSLSGPIVTIRKFRPQFQSLDDLVRQGTIDPDTADWLREAVVSRQNILIAGNTGSGKTTLLNALSGFISPEERIITLEDTAELKLRQRHVIRLETRLKNTEGAGEITMADLLTNALRMRPDRIIIGECRGGEVVQMLQALNTGHDGSMSTIHSNSAQDALRRLESLVLLAAPEWPVEVIRQQIAAAIDVVIYLKRSGRDRRLTELTRLSMTNGEIDVHPIREPACA